MDAIVLHKSVFASPGTPMAAAEHGDQQFVDHFVLPDDDFANFLAHSLVGGGQSANCLFFQSFWCNIFTGVGTLCGTI